MKKVIFKESTFFEGISYRKDGVYELPEKAVYALGSSVGVLESVSSDPMEKAIESPKADKMIKKAPRNKNI